MSFWEKLFGKKEVHVYMASVSVDLMTETESKEGNSVEIFQNEYDALQWTYHKVSKVMKGICWKTRLESVYTDKNGKLNFNPYGKYTIYGRGIGHYSDYDTMCDENGNENKILLISAYVEKKLVR